MCRNSPQLLELGLGLTMPLIRRLGGDSPVVAQIRALWLLGEAGAEEVEDEEKLEIHKCMSWIDRAD